MLEPHNSPTTTSRTARRGARYGLCASWETRQGALMRHGLGAALAGAMTCACALILVAAPDPAFAAKSTERGLFCSSQSAGSEVKIQIIARAHAADGTLDQLRVVCVDGEEKVDLALPKRWVDFVVHHLGGEVEIDGDDLDLKLLWATIEDLAPGEEILIEEHGGSKVRVWLE